MGQVEWTRLEGGQVEAVVAMFVNRERPNSTRITPSRGDGGVDILDRGAGPGGSDVVYQVKCYCAPLTARQKAEIEGSLTTLQKELKAHKRWAGLTVKEWHLVLPWDPTPEADAWLQSLGDTGITKTWHGLTWADQQAARYNDIVDYYLHGGRARVDEAYSTVAALFGLEKVESSLTVPEVTERLQEAVKILGHDPHYRYELRLGEGKPPPPPKKGERPGLVMHQLMGIEGGRWTSVDIIARCAASAEERPITIDGTFRAEPGSEFASQLEDFLMYGTPFTSPEGAFEGNIDAPGGLGGDLTGGVAAIGPVADADLGQNPELRVEVLDPDDVVLAGVDVDRVERSEGIKGGLRAVLEEVHGAFSIEDRYDLENSQTRRTLSMGDLTGLPVVVAHNSMKVVSHLHPPNKMRISVRHTPPEHGLVNTDIDFGRDGDFQRYLGAITAALEMLTQLQAHASEQIRVPEFAELPAGQPKTWHNASLLLQGAELIGTYPESDPGVSVDLGSEVTPAQGEDVQIQLPLTVLVGDQLIELGDHIMVLPTPTLVERIHDDEVVRHIFTTPDRKLRWRRSRP